MRVYSMRMEILFHRLDGTQNSRLELHELQGHLALARRLKRQNNRSYLRLDDLRSTGTSHRPVVHACNVIFNRPIRIVING
jgi:hypothetical protein